VAVRANISSTAIAAAEMRREHVATSASPLIETDYGAELAGDLVLEFRTLLSTLPEAARQEACLPVAFRSRLAEDLLRRTRPAQYVQLGAGLETFPLRHRALIAEALIDVFEVDRKPAQDWKRARLDELGIDYPARLIDCDLARESISAALIRERFRRSETALVSILGVTQYLDSNDFEAVVADLGDLLCSGSFILVSYVPPASDLAPDPELRAGVAASLSAEEGEPWTFRPRREELIDIFVRHGFAADEHVLRELVVALGPAADGAQEIERVLTFVKREAACGYETS
jgi:methyltransferase (TIGR00027 family)